MGSRVTWRDVAGMEGQIELGFAEVFIGRAVECAIRTDDPLVSRRHARIYFQNGGYVIEDLNSANGIFVGEVRTPSHALQNGDSVRCGNLWLRYVSDAVPAFPGVPAGPQMSPGGGTQILQVNEPFIPGHSAEPSRPSGGPSPVGGPGLGGPGLGGPGLGGLPPNPFGPPMGAPPMPPMPMGGGPPMGATSLPMGVPPLGAPPPPVPLGPGPSLGGFGAPPPPMPGFGAPPPPVASPGPPPISGSIGGSISPGLGGPPPPAPGPGPRTSSPVGPSGSIDMEEVQRMQRRIDQLTSELRMQRGGGDRAVRMEELEEKVSRLERDNQKLEEAYKALEKLAANAGDTDVSRAVFQLSRAEEVVTGLNDVISELRINLLAADGEIEQYAHILPPASFELVREAIRTSRMQMETARDLMRMLREVR